MKKLVFFALTFVGVYLTACNKDTLAPDSQSSTISSNAVTGGGGKDSVAISALPAAITTYITANYAGAVIKHARKDASGNYFVGILVGTTPKILSFDSTGKFLAVLVAPPAAPKDTTHKGGFPPMGGDTTHKGGFPPMGGDTTHKGGFPPMGGDTTHKGGFPPMKGDTSNKGKSPKHG